MIDRRRSTVLGRVDDAMGSTGMPLCRKLDGDSTVDGRIAIDDAGGKFGGVDLGDEDGHSIGLRRGSVPWVSADY